jgi:hypothetical protein
MKQARVSKSWISYNKEIVLVSEMIPTWYWLSRALHAISTQGKSDRTGTVAMVEFRLGHSTTAIVGPLCWSLQTESHACHELQNMETPQWSIQ